MHNNINRYTQPLINWQKLSPMLCSTGDIVTIIIKTIHPKDMASLHLQTTSPPEAKHVQPANH